MKSKVVPWMKSNPYNYNPAKQDFIAKEISSTAGGFNPSNRAFADGFNCAIQSRDYAFALSSAKISLRRSSVVGLASLSSLAASAAASSAFFFASTFSAM